MGTKAGGGGVEKAEEAQLQRGVNTVENMNGWNNGGPKRSSFVM